MKRVLWTICFLVTSIAHSQNPPEPITFPSLDSLTVHANLYEISEDAPVIVLCHQARFNKFEYDGIAEQLNEMGFTCLAIDQRSGGPIASKQNETKLNAEMEDKPTGFLDAEQDIVAAVNYAAKKYGKKVILWGSSYSSTLVLYVAASNDNVSAVISFSPGNYFADKKGSLVPIIAEFDKPMFLTSSQQEAPSIEEILDGKALGEKQVHFVPEGPGHHGSRALWKNQTGGEEYWKAIASFLSKL